MDVSYEDILDFKAKRKGELSAFRAKIRELETNICIYLYLQKETGKTKTNK